MKNYITSILFIVASTNCIFAQIRSNNAISNTIPAQSAFLDAGTGTFSSSTNNGKGLVFPRTNLTTFTFVTPTTSALNFNTAYDGMIVYNTATGTTPASGSGVGNQSVTPGYYYFSNPTGGSGNGYASATGQWLPLGQSPQVDIKTTETITNTLVDGAQVYARKGTFTTDGSSTSPISYSSAITIPDTATDGIYRVTIYAPGTNSVYATTVYSFNPTTGALVTGSPSISVVYPAGTYPYTVEYFK
ncbi:hypothetical protein MUU74_09505 [Chryseobacterium daecheongense]|uniref:hypothetical protein n=1 Tax=Chryseobacterium daecheongense TaxID=192389 RepID=UPI001FD63EE5|nr:hypothetical protein [Chryseobacterium daecheongense]UOU96730.1 hypothetical protein MUU74_09505 [Chryseobacterium daecheongense]